LIYELELGNAYDLLAIARFCSNIRLMIRGKRITQKANAIM